MSWIGCWFFFPAVFFQFFQFLVGVGVGGWSICSHRFRVLVIKGREAGCPTGFSPLVKIESSPFSLLLWQTRGEAGGNISVEACRSDILQGAALSSYAPNALRAACRVGTLDGTTEFPLCGPGVAGWGPTGTRRAGLAAYVAGKNYRSMAPSLSPNLRVWIWVRKSESESERPSYQQCRPLPTFHSFFQ